MKKIGINFSAIVLFLFFVFSCEKEELDPTQPPVIETISGLDAENQVNLLINEGRTMEFLIDLQDDDIWRACYNTNNFDIVYIYGVQARIILDLKQKKIDKKLRNVVTVYNKRFNVYVNSDYLATIYNKNTVRFYKASTSRNITGPNCKDLNYYISTAQTFGGVFVK